MVSVDRDYCSDFRFQERSKHKLKYGPLWTLNNSISHTHKRWVTSTREYQYPNKILETSIIVGIKWVDI